MTDRSDVVAAVGTAPARVSVLMTVYNGARHLRAAVRSILDQSYRDFEFVIVDDGSSDGSQDIVRSFNDPRIRLIEIDHRGLTYALNTGWQACRGDLIARMDADDVALPERLEVQIQFLQAHPDIDIVCTDVISIDEDGRVVGREVCADLDNDKLRAALLYQRRVKPVVHPSVVMRKSVIAGVGGYRDYVCAEDHDLWLRCIDQFEIRRINKCLLQYRFSAAGISRNKAAQQRVSGCLSAVNYLVSKSTSQDIFSDHPEIMRWAEEEAGRIIEARLSHQVAKFSEARRLVREGKIILGGASLALSVLRYGPAVLPQVAQARLANIVSELSRGAIAKLHGRQGGRIAA